MESPLNEIPECHERRALNHDPVYCRIGRRDGNDDKSEFVETFHIIFGQMVKP